MSGLASLPLPVKLGLGYLAYRLLHNAPPWGSSPPQASGSPVYAKVTSNQGRQCETWTWTAPQYAFVARCGDKWISVVQTAAGRVPVKSNATGTELEILRKEWL